MFIIFEQRNILLISVYDVNYHISDCLLIVNYRTIVDYLSP